MIFASKGSGGQRQAESIVIVLEKVGIVGTVVEEFSVDTSALPLAAVTVMFPPKFRVYNAGVTGCQAVTPPAPVHTRVSPTAGVVPTGS